MDYLYLAVVCGLSVFVSHMVSVALVSHYFVKRTMRKCAEIEAKHEAVLGEKLKVFKNLLEEEHNKAVGHASMVIEAMEDKANSPSKENN